MFVHHANLDAMLEYIATNCTRLDICTAEPKTYQQATTTFSVGLNVSMLRFGPCVDRQPTGRKITIEPIADGTVTGTGTASHWALSNGVDTLFAAGLLQELSPVTSGNRFSLAAFEIGVPDKPE